MASDNLKPSVTIREVWSDNLVSEFGFMSGLVDRYPFVSMDTEFPGVIFKTSSPSDHYRTLKSNVDVLSIIQLGLGLILSDSAGNLPDLGYDERFIWQFNFSDFDGARNPHAADSVELLRAHGIDFERNRAAGIDWASFAEVMMSSGLVCNDAVCWVTLTVTLTWRWSRNC